MHQSFFTPNYMFNNDAYFLDFRAQKFPLIFFNVSPFKHHQTLHFGVLNYEKQHKEGTCKVLERSVVFSAFYADFCLYPKSVIITTLSQFISTSEFQVRGDTEEIIRHFFLFLNENICCDPSLEPSRRDCSNDGS